MDGCTGKLLVVYLYVGRITQGKKKKLNFTKLGREVANCGAG